MACVDSSIRSNYDGLRIDIKTKELYISENSNPYVAQFIGERPRFSGSASRLPSFATTTQSGTVYFGGSYYSISILYNSYWYYKNTMVQSGCSQANIGLSGVNTGGSFTQTYQNSCGT